MNKSFFAQVVLCAFLLPLSGAEHSAAVVAGTVAKIQQLRMAEEAKPFWDEKLQRYNLTCPAHFDALKVWLQTQKMKDGTVFVLRNKVPLSEKKTSHFTLVGANIAIVPLIRSPGFSKYTLSQGPAAATSSHFMVSPVEGNLTVELKLGETCTFEVV